MASKLLVYSLYKVVECLCRREISSLCFPPKDSVIIKVWQFPFPSADLQNGDICIYSSIFFVASLINWLMVSLCLLVIAWVQFLKLSVCECLSKLTKDAGWCDVTKQMWFMTIPICEKGDVCVIELNCLVIMLDSLVKVLGFISSIAKLLLLHRLFLSLLQRSCVFILLCVFWNWIMACCLGRFTATCWIWSWPFQALHSGKIQPKNHDICIPRLCTSTQNLVEVQALC